MSLRILVPVLAAAGMLAPLARAESPQAAAEALHLLQKVANAVQKQNYSGVFVYSSGERSETSRITHLVTNGSEFERLEVLDGSPREVIRHDDEIKCFLPDSKLMIVERRNSRQQFFPTLVPGNLASLVEYYSLRKGAMDRVAGVDSRIIVVEPRDEYRFGRRFWVDPQTGLLLKASLIGASGTPLETFAFTELKIGGHMTAEALKPQTRPTESGWQVQHVRSSESRPDDGQWVFHNGLPGFRRTAGMKRQLREGGPGSTQLIFSDGLAAISVFLESMDGREKEAPSTFSMGPVNIYKRQVADHQVIVMGDVPMAAIRYFGDGIEPRRK